MTIFPALVPSLRTFTPGRHPHSEILSIDGLQSRVRTSNTIVDQRLRMTFTALTESQMLSIRSHYTDRQGRFLSFPIPDSLFRGMSTPAGFTPVNSSWLYASPPRVEDVPGLQRYTVSVELVNAPPENIVASGFALNVNASLQTGVEIVIPGVATATFDPPLEIENDTYLIALEVTGLESPITKVEITIDFTKVYTAIFPGDPPEGAPFTYNREIYFSLDGPDETGIFLAQGIGQGSAATSDSAIITYGDDAPSYGPVPYPDPDVLVSGFYKPYSELSYFNGQDGNGTWYLRCTDYDLDNPLLINSVSLIITD